MTSAPPSSTARWPPSCPNVQPHAPHPNVPRRSKRVSSAHASRPSEICMRSLTRPPTRPSTPAQDSSDRSLPTPPWQKNRGSQASLPARLLVPEETETLDGACKPHPRLVTRHDIA